MGQEKSPGGFASLDLLRGLAAIGVLVAHVRGSNWVEFGQLIPSDRHLASAAFFFVTRLGHEAVLVFFVLSGALVGGQVIDRVRSGRFDVFAYGIDRATRIFLPLIPACLFCAAVSTIFLHSQPAGWTVLANIAGQGNVLAPVLSSNVPLWSLTYEIWFYVIAGAIGCAITKQYQLLALAMFALATAVFTILSPLYLLFWAAGALATTARGTPLRLGIFLAGLTLFLAGIASYELAIPSKLILPFKLASPQLAEAMICGGLCMLLPTLYSKEARRLLARIAIPVSKLSAVSYSIYLFHYPILEALDTTLPRANSLTTASFGLFAVRLLICLIGCLIAYFLFERNTDRIRSFWKSRVQARAELAPSTI